MSTATALGSPGPPNPGTMRGIDARSGWLLSSLGLKLVSEPRSLSFAHRFNPHPTTSPVASTAMVVYRPAATATAPRPSVAPRSTLPGIPLLQLDPPTQTSPGLA
eukprot:CAMPEP_0114259490 /NCGR_PEP_ID=MMETSP0058-20121206/19921_1 /TAXON_ID=36894 /ORGANISM="Pyramimonas parkeae, CCMP726" /LENGTH=104 /DNA_ID=CAMNT_0001374541 /DNA_START=819 /DNA_END=1133 /DNA_ORIENTATION=+